MELFYYCLSAPKEDSLNHTHHYVPPDPIVYDERPEQCDEHLSDDESVVQELREGEEPLNYTDLNDSLHEVEIENEKLRAEAALSPVEEDAVDEPDVIEPELAANLMKRNNSRKFKTPSFKWKKKKKREPATMESPEPYAPAAPVPSAPELTMSEDPIDADSNLDFEDKQIELFDKKISLDSLTDQLQKKESDAAAEAVASDAEVDRLKRDVELFQDRLRESEELLARFRTDNALLQQRVELAERDRGAIQHGNYMELEKVRAEYQSKIDELSTYPERLSSAEARCADAESTADALRSQLADRNTTVADLQSKIDLFQGQIGKLKEKFHSVNEDNIELSNKAQSHERKVLEADLHNKNLMDLVNKKDDSVEQHQLQVDGELATLPPVPTADPPSPPSVSDNNAEEDTETETESTDESEEEVDWSEMLKNAESNRERLGLDNMESDGESSVDEEGNRYIKKKATNGLTSADIMNRMATNQFLGFDEFGRPIGGKPNGIGGMSGKKGHKNRSMLFGVDGGKRNKTKGANNRGAGGKERSGRNGGGRRAKKGGNMALLGF